MELSNTQIAKLVLGYLRSVNCISACKDFLHNSPDLQECMNKIKREKFFVSRVAGLSLVEILTEYARISTLVQERLEASNYYDQKRTSTALSEQLIYLLDNANNIRMETPIPFSRCSTPFRQKPYDKPYCSPENSIYNEFIHHDDLNTTQLKQLPGYSAFCNVNKRKASPILNQQNQQSSDSRLGELLSQTMIEHQDLCEKIAENINLVRNVNSDFKEKETPIAEAICLGAAKELDAKIKTIVQKTEADPTFEKFLGEIFGDEAVDDESDKATKKEKPTNLSGNQPKKSHLVEILPKPVKITKINEEILIEGQNNDAIQSIIAASKNPEVPQKQINVQTVLTTCTPIQEIQPVNKITSNIAANMGEVIMYDGTLDNFIKNSNNPQPQPVIINQNGLLMVQPSVTNLPSSSIQEIVSSKPCYILPGKSSQYSSSNILTEQDIMNMPTVLVNQAPSTQQTMSLTKKKQIPKGKVAIPKAGTECSQVLQEFISFKAKNEIISKPKKKSIKVEKVSTIKNLPPEKIVPRFKTHIIKLPNKDKGKLINITAVKTNPTEPIVPSSVEPEKSSQMKEVTPDIKTQGTKKSTPKSGSHIRQLDFNSSPLKSSQSHATKVIKKIVADRTTVNKPAIVPLLNTEKTAQDKESKKEPSSWDADLRALACTNKSASPKKNKKRARAKSTAKKSKEENNLSTELDGAKIEQELLNASSLDISNEQKEKDKDDKTAIRKSSSPNLSLQPKLNKSKTPTQDSATDEMSNPINTEETEQIKINDDQSSSCFIAENQLGLINLHSKPKYRKKCNIENNVKKEVKVAKVKEVKVLDVVTDGSNKLILSPSKLNANKRSLVDTNNINENESGHKNDSIHKIDNVELNEPSDKFITPDEVKQDHNHPVITKYNITPMLETPMKMDHIVPKTPGLFSPVSTSDTPFTKVFKEQTQGVDLTNIQTPKFPLTPNFPITPLPGETSYCNRPTDYSTSSSYYQPSDNEQNKSLEQQIIEECKRLEKLTPLKEPGTVPEMVTTSAIHTEILEKSTSTNLNQLPEHNSRNIKKQVLSEVIMEKNDTLLQIENQSEIQKHLVHQAIVEQMKCFKSNVIGRKNLQLVKNDSKLNVSNTSISSDESSDSCSSSTTSGSSWSGSPVNKTVIDNSNEKRNTRYSLRLRSQTAANAAEDKDVTKTIKKIINNADVKVTLNTSDENKTNYQERVLRELEEKRKRTIERFKDNKGTNVKTNTRTRKSNIANTKSKGSASTPLRRNKKGKFISAKKSKRNTKSIPKPSPANEVENISANEPVNVVEKEGECSNVEKASKTDKKIETETNQKDTSIEPQDTTLNKDHSKTFLTDTSEQEILFHLSSEEEDDGSFVGQNSEKLDNSTEEDVEAEKLVKGLQLRGIHLVRNKSPLAKGKQPEQLNGTENNAVEPLDVNRQKETNNPGLEEGEIVSDEDEKKSLVKKRTLATKVGSKDKKIESTKQSNLNINKEERKDATNEAAHTSSKKTTTKKSVETKIIKKSESSKQTKINPVSKKDKALETPKEIECNKKELSTCSSEKIAKSNLKQTTETKTSRENSREKEPFEVKEYCDETVSLVHDENKPVNRQISDYDTDILKKKVNATICVDDKLVSKQLSVTDFATIVDIPKSYNNSKEAEVASSNKELKQVERPRKIISAKHKQSKLASKSSPKYFTNSPLDDLYASPHASSYSKRKSPTKPKNVEHKKIHREVENINKNKQLNIDDTITPPKHVENAISSSDSQTKSTVDVKDESERKKNTSDLKKKPTNNSGIEKDQIDLMNLALGLEDSNVRRPAKRKATDDNVKSSAKKMLLDLNTTELFKKVDVDIFLKKLHGDT